MQAGLLILILAAAPVTPPVTASTPPAPKPAPALAEEPKPNSPQGELALAERAFRDGLYEMVALRMKKLLGSQEGVFPGKDRAKLMLAESEYLTGMNSGDRKRLETAEGLLAAFPREFPRSDYVDECRIWIGRLETEFRGQHDAAERRLRELYAKLRGARGVDQELLGACRYYLAKALVEQGGSLKLDGYDEPIPDTDKSKRVHGAIELLDGYIRSSANRLQAEAHVLRGRALYARGKPEVCCRKLLEEFLDNARYKKSPLRGEAYFWQAEARYGQGRWMQAARLFADSAKASGVFERKRDRERARRAMYGRGWALLKRAGDLRRAGLAGDIEILKLSLQSFRVVMKSSGDDLAKASRLRSGEILYQLAEARKRERKGDAAAIDRLYDAAIDELDDLYDDKLRGVEAMYLSSLAETGKQRHAAAGKLLERAAKKLKNKGLLYARVEFSRGENFYRLTAELDAGKTKEHDKLLADAAGSFGRVTGSGAPLAERYLARLWLARVKAEQGLLTSAVSEVEKLQKEVLARETLRKDRLAYYRGLFLLKLSRQARAEAEAADRQNNRKKQESSKTASENYAGKSIRMFSEARLAGPRGKFAVPAMLGAAEAHLVRNEQPDAYRLYRILGAHPGAEPGQIHLAHFGVAKTLAAGKRFKKAAEYVNDKLLKVRPAPGARLLRQAVKLRADCLAASDFSTEASDAYALLAETAGSLEAKTRAGINRALQLGKTGKHAEAAAELADLVQDCPRKMRAEVLLRTAEAYLRAGHSDKALDYFKNSARTEGPFKITALVSAAELELEADKPTAAVAHARTAMDAAPAGSLLSARAALVRARALLSVRKFGAAARQYRQAAEAARAQQASERNRKRILEDRTNQAKAAPEIAEAQRAVEEGRKRELEAREGLGDALAKLKRYEDAAASYLKAAYLLDTAKPDVRMLELAAGVLQRGGKPTAALEVRALIRRRKR